MMASYPRVFTGVGRPSPGDILYGIPLHLILSDA